MDNFHEEIVSRQRTAFESLLSGLSFIVMIIAGFLAINSLFSIFGGFNVILIISTIVFGAITYGAYVFRGKLATEFEYTFTNGELDIAKVILNKRRKELLSINIKEVEMVAPANSDGFKRVLHDRNISKTLRYHLTRDITRLYYAVFKGDKGRTLLIIEPSERLLDLFKSYIPRKLTK